MRNRRKPATQRERLRDEIWLTPSPSGVTVRDLEASGFKTSTIYRVVNMLLRTGEVEKVTVDGVVRFKPVNRSTLTSSPGQELILKILRANPPSSPVGLKAWIDLDDLSMQTRIKSEPLLKFLLQPERAKTERVLRILTRQALMAREENDRETLGRMKRQLDQADSTVRDWREDVNLRDAAFLYVKTLQPARALNIAMDLISQDYEDPALDAPEPTQLHLNLTGTIRNDASNPSVTTQLYNLAAAQTTQPNSPPAKRAIELLQTINQPFTTLHTTPSQTIPAATTEKTSVKQAQKRNTEQSRTPPNNPEPGRTSPNVTEQAQPVGN